MNKLFIGCLIFSSLLQSNEISFNQVTEPSQNTIEISLRSDMSGSQRGQLERSNYAAQRSH